MIGKNFFKNIEGKSDTMIEIQASVGGEKSRGIDECKVVAAILNSAVKFTHNSSVFIIDKEGGVAQIK